MTLLNLSKNDIGYLRLLIDICSCEDAHEDRNVQSLQDNNNSAQSKHFYSHTKS
jgi:hypothetical protein